MNKNCYGVIKLNENEVIGLTKPKGFVVRERFVDGTPVSLEYGTYIDNDIFLGVPVHYSMKSSFIPTESDNAREFKYYVLPQLRQFAVSTYTNKKTGKVNPILVEPSDENPAVLISSLAYRDNRNSITNVTINDNSLVLRKYIDKARKVIGLIMVNPDPGTINPSTKVTLEVGVIGSSTYSVMDYRFDTTIEGGYHKTTLTKDTDGTALNTSFIKLMNFINPNKQQSTKPKFNKDKKPFNNQNK